MAIKKIIITLAIRDYINVHSEYNPTVVFLGAVVIMVTFDDT